LTLKIGLQAVEMNMPAGRTAKSANLSSSRPIRALIDAIEDTPIEMYGMKRSRHLRRLAHIVLAKHADANGTNAFPSIARLAYLCLASERATQDAINHLVSVGLVRRLDDSNEVFGTRCYELVALPADVVARERDRRWETLKRKREATSARVSRWRSRYRPAQDVTEEPGITVTEATVAVTDQDVTADCNACNGRLDGAVTADSDACNGKLGGYVTEATVAVYRPTDGYRPKSPSTTTPAGSGQATGDGTAVDDAAVSQNPFTSKPTGTASEGSSFDREAFLVKQRDLWNDQCFNTFRCTAKHLDASVEAATRYGVADYLAALQFWADELEEADTTLSIDPTTKRVTRFQWPLHAFLTKSLPYCIEQVRKPHVTEPEDNEEMEVEEVVAA
jgi:hypothetical protein